MKDIAINREAWRSWYLGKEGIIDEDMPKLAKMFMKNNISKILDLGCGTGRHAIYFADNGFDVYAFDFSLYAIKRSKQRLKERNLSAHLTVSDMREKFPYGNYFFDAIIAIRVINHARIATIKHIVSEIHRTTRNGGYFDAQIPTMERRLKHEKLWLEEKQLEPGTWIPSKGPEKGVPYHRFNREELCELLSLFDFEAKEISEKDEHYNLLAVKRVEAQ